MLALHPCHSLAVCSHLCVGAQWHCVHAQEGIHVAPSALYHCHQHVMFTMLRQTAVALLQQTQTDSCSNPNNHHRTQATQPAATAVPSKMRPSHRQ